MLFFLEKIVCEFFRSANILFKKENYIPQWIENAIPKSMHLYFASIFWNCIFVQKVLQNYSSMYLNIHCFNSKDSNHLMHAANTYYSIVLTYIEGEQIMLTK